MCHVFIFRENGVMITITAWQWAFEFLLNIGLIVFAKTTLSSGVNTHGFTTNKMLFLFYIFCTLVIGPSFYLMSDLHFRVALDQHGFFKAFWQRLKNLKA
jgi:hypothetical protein